LGTVGGNTVGGIPAGDVALALVALGTLAEVCSADNACEEKIFDIYKGIGLSNVDNSKEIITHFKIIFSTNGNFGSAFIRIPKRKGVSLPTVKRDVAVALGGDIINHCHLYNRFNGLYPFMGYFSLKYFNL
jgi:carbon-monoxide dehydrogenase medium subunit